MFPKIFFLTVILSSTFTYSFAQLRLGLAPIHTIPIGDFGSVNKNGFGPTLSAKYQLNERWALTSNFSYVAYGREGDDLKFFLQTYGFNESTATLIVILNSSLQKPLTIPRVSFFPIEAGFEYAILKTGKVKPYFGVNLGIYVQKTEETSLRIYELLFQTNQLLPSNQRIPEATLQNLIPVLGNSTLPLNGNNANFGLTPLIGCRYDWAERWSVDLSIKSALIAVPERETGVMLIQTSLGVFYKLNVK